MLLTVRAVVFMNASHVKAYVLKSIEPTELVLLIVVTISMQLVTIVHSFAR